MNALRILIHRWPTVGILVMVLGNVALLLASIAAWVYLVSYTSLASQPWLIIMAFPTYFFISIYFYSKLK
jgi:hypothetical protein